MSNKLIQALEPRLMLDGAAVATAIDAVDDLAQFQKSESDKSPKADHFKGDKDTKLPFVNLDAPCEIIQSLSISPNLRPPSRDLPSAGCLVRATIGPIERLCVLSKTICFNL